MRNLKPFRPNPSVLLPLGEDNIVQFSSSALVTSSTVSTLSDFPAIWSLLSGCILYLDPNYGVTIGTGVSALADQSGAGNNASQATGAKQPTLVSNGIGGRPSLQGNGTSQYLSTGTLSAAIATWFVVGTIATPASARAIIGGSDGATNGHLLYSDTSTTMQAVFTASNDQTVNATLPHVYAVKTGAAFYVDGLGNPAALTGSTPNLTPLTLCGDKTNGLYSDGLFSCVVGFNRVLSSGEMSTIGRALAARFSISGTW